MSDTNPLTPHNANHQAPIATPPTPQPTASDLESERLAQKILLGLSSKRSEESFEEFQDRVIGLFREKGLFRNEPPSAG